MALPDDPRRGFWRDGRTLDIFLPLFLALSTMAMLSMFPEIWERKGGTAQLAVGTRERKIRDDVNMKWLTNEGLLLIDTSSINKGGTLISSLSLRYIMT